MIHFSTERDLEYTRYILNVASSFGCQFLHRLGKVLLSWSRLGDTVRVNRTDWSASKEICLNPPSHATSELSLDMGARSRLSEMIVSP
jgi:hypothetical protein